MPEPRLIPLTQYRDYPLEEMQRRAADFYADVNRRRTVRDFAERPVPRGIIENCLRAANTAPSGANKQPWHFVVVSDPAVKRQIREAAEAVERDFYARRATDAWLDDLAELGTTWQKPFLETAPILIAVFAQTTSLSPDGSTSKNYYVTESVGLATGLLITAIHQAGLVSLTHTPSPMQFLSEILGRPANERPFLLLVVGYPAADARVPDLQRKPLEEIATFI